MQAVSRTRVQNLLQKIANLRALVVGDPMLDRYARGAFEPSGEPPFTKFLVTGEEIRLGGAANAANNARALGAQVAFVGVTGADFPANLLDEKLRERGIGSFLVRDPRRLTTQKERVVVGMQTLMRVDRESREPLCESAAEEFFDHARSSVKRADVLLLSDYNKGVLTEGDGGTLRRLLSLARAANLPVVVDPRRAAALYAGAAALSPNRKEALEMTAMKDVGAHALSLAGEKILADAQAEALCVTCGAEGVVLFEKGCGELRIPARRREVFDVTGAGDTFAATLALVRAAGAAWLEAAQIANAAAGAVVGKSGTATLTPEELLAEFDP